MEYTPGTGGVSPLLTELSMRSVLAHGNARGKKLSADAILAILEWKYWRPRTKDFAKHWCYFFRVCGIPCRPPVYSLSYFEGSIDTRNNSAALPLSVFHHNFISGDLCRHGLRQRRERKYHAPAGREHFRGSGAADHDRRGKRSEKFYRYGYERL